jgi:hypothetical protein
MCSVWCVVFQSTRVWCHTSRVSWWMSGGNHARPWSLRLALSSQCVCHTSRVSWGSALWTNECPLMCSVWCIPVNVYVILVELAKDYSMDVRRESCEGMIWGQPSAPWTMECPLPPNSTACDNSIIIVWWNEMMSLYTTNLPGGLLHVHVCGVCTCTFLHFISILTRY